MGRLASVCVMLGLATSIALSLFVAWVRGPVRSFGGNVVAASAMKRPFNAGGATMTTIQWVIDDQHRFAERTMVWFGLPASQWPPEPLSGRPSFYPPIDAFFDRTYLPNPADRSLARADRWIARAFGWPMRCLWEGECGDGLNYRLTSWPWRGQSYGGIEIGPGGGLPHCLPTLPLWPGLIVDTLVFACAWLGAFLLSGPARRARLRRRGLCEHCRYDLRGTPPTSPCPECGATAADGRPRGSA